MSESVTNLLQAVGAYVDQSTDLPTGDELVSRISYLDQSQKEWAGAYDWDVLKRVSGLTYVVSAVSFGLDANFKKLKSPVQDVTNSYIYNEIDPQERFGKSETDKYVYILGDTVTGKYIALNPAISSGVSMIYDWLAFPTALATLQDVSACPNSEYLTKRTIAYVLESRSDPRFPQVKAVAQLLLNRMIADQDAGSGGKVNTIPSFMGGRYVIGE